MFLSKARPELESIQEQLRGWQTSMPPRARRFHGVVADLDTELHKVQAPWRLVIGDEVLERLRDRTRRLRGVAGPLGELIRAAERLGEEVRMLGQRGQDAGSPQVAQWLERKCRDWSILLDNLGTDCDRESDLQRDRHRLDDAESAIRLHDQALSWLQEARRVLSLLGADLKAASLQAALPDLELALLRDGGSLEWLHQIKTLVQPLKDQANRIQDPPQELKTVSLLLTDLRGWSRQLGEPESRVEQLEQRHRFYAADWNPADLQDLAGEAERLRDHLVARAQELRSRKLEELEAQMTDLFQACGHQPELKARFDELKLRPLDRYQYFSAWMTQFQRVEQLFWSTATNQEGGLQKRLTRLVEGLRQGLQALRAQPLSDAVREETGVLEYDVGQIAQAEGAEAMLRGLRRSSGLEDRIAELSRQATRDLEELSRQQKELLSLNEELQQQAREIGMDFPDLTPRIEELNHGAEEPSLERARQLAGTLAGEMDTLRSWLIQHCRELLDRQLAEIRGIAGVLQQVGKPFSLAALPAFAEDAGAREAVQALAAGTDLRERVQKAAEEALRDFEGRRKQARTALEQIHLESLGPGEKETAEQLLQEVEDGSWSLPAALADRLAGLALLVEKSDLLFQQLHQEERSALDHLAVLQRRMQRLRDNQMRQFCPELTSRVEALVYGIPGKPWQWSAVHEQLDLAERLFTQVEVQATRMAADQLDRAVRHLRNGSGLAQEPEVRMLLEELDRYDQEELPPVILRLKIVNAAQRRTHGGFHT